MGELLDLLLKAQHQAALNNDNVSSAIIKQMAVVKEPFEKAIAAALLSLGGPVHGPTKDARYVLFTATDEEVRDRLKRGERLPGFGNQFYDTVDPAFAAFFTYIENNHREIWLRVAHVTSLIVEDRGKFLFPNAALATAITAQLLNIPEGTEIKLLIAGRLNAWAQQWIAAR